MTATAATTAHAATVLARCASLAAYSEEPGRITRPFATPALRRAGDAVAGWMRAAGMATRYDSIGNLVGRYPAGSAGGPTLLLGSHLDSVRDAGQYDGPLGVLIALASVERLRERGTALPYALELYAFADEEGLRYHTPYLGSSAVAGTFDPANLALTDDAGITMAEALRAVGGDPAALATARRPADGLLGYCEVHIEQGPVLETAGLPVGVVAAVAGQTRCAVTFTGRAGHAGTVPMASRHDALCAAAEFVLAVEVTARRQPGMVATVGQLRAEPGASNVIPAQVSLSLDVRDQQDARRETTVTQLRDAAASLATRRGVTLDWREVQAKRTTPCSPRLTRLLSAAVAGRGYAPRLLPSGAGHDAVALASLTEVAMLFVRCTGGVSHHPDEAVTVDDVAVAIAVLDGFLALLAAEQAAWGTGDAPRR